jgi:hypothetical protein
MPTLNPPPAQGNDPTTALLCEPPRPKAGSAGGEHGVGQMFALLLIPFIVVGYYLAITLLKLIGQRAE